MNTDIKKKTARNNVRVQGNYIEVHGNESVTLNIGAIKKNKYYANFKTNNGTRWQTDREFTSLNKAIKETRAAAESERTKGSTADWGVWDENGKCVAFGTIADWGFTRVRDLDLMYYNK